MGSIIAQRRDGKGDFGFLLYALLHTVGFLAVTLLMTRYVAAEPARIADFKVLVAALHAVVAGLLIVFRRHAIVPRDVISAGSKSA